MNETSNATTTETTTTPAKSYEEVMAELEAAKAAAKAARALLATLPKPPKAPRATLTALDTREGLFAQLWTRGLSYHADGGKPLSVEAMRKAVEEWNGQHTPDEVEQARGISEQKLALARASKGNGRGKGDRGAELESPFRGPSKAAAKAAAKAAKAREEAEKAARAMFEAAGMNPTPEQWEKAVAGLLARNAAPAATAPATAPAAATPAA